MFFLQSLNNEFFSHYKRGKIKIYYQCDDGDDVPILQAHG